MYEKVQVLGIKREEGWLYFLRGSDVYRTPLKRSGSDRRGRAEQVTTGNFERVPGYHYFIDERGDVSRAPSHLTRSERPTPQKFVVGFLFDPDFHWVVLIRKNRPTWMAGRYNGIGGKVEGFDEIRAAQTGQTAEMEAMVREWREETGDDQEVDWKPFLQLTTRGGVIYFFAGVGSVVRPRTVTDEYIDDFPTCDLPRNVLPNLNWLVPMAREHLRESDSCDYFKVSEASYRSELDKG